MCMLYAKSSDDNGDIGFQTKTDPGTIGVYLNAKGLACQTEVCYPVFLREFCFHFNRSSGGSLWI